MDKLTIIIGNILNHGYTPEEIRGTITEFEKQKVKVSGSRRIKTTVQAVFGGIKQIGVSFIEMQITKVSKKQEVAHDRIVALEEEKQQFVHNKEAEQPFISRIEDEKENLKNLEKQEAELRARLIDKGQFKTKEQIEQAEPAIAVDLEPIAPSPEPTPAPEIDVAVPSPFNPIPVEPEVKPEVEPKVEVEPVSVATPSGDDILGIESMLSEYFEIVSAVNNNLQANISQYNQITNKLEEMNSAKKEIDASLAKMEEFNRVFETKKQNLQEREEKVKAVEVEMQQELMRLENYQKELADREQLLDQKETKINESIAKIVETIKPTLENPNAQKILQETKQGHSEVQETEQAKQLTK